MFASITPRCDRVCDPLWTVELNRPIFGSPAILNGVLYVVTSGDPRFTAGNLHAYTAN